MHPGQHQKMVQNIMFKQIWSDIHTKPTKKLSPEVPVSKQKAIVTQTKRCSGSMEGKIFRGTRLTQVIDGDTSTPASKRKHMLVFPAGLRRQSLIKRLEMLLIRTWSCHRKNPSRQSTRVSLQIKAHFPSVTLHCSRVLHAGKQKQFQWKEKWTTPILFVDQFYKRHNLYSPKTRSVTINQVIGMTQALINKFSETRLESVKIVEAFKKDVLGRKQEATSISVFPQTRFLMTVSQV